MKALCLIALLSFCFTLVHAQDNSAFTELSSSNTEKHPDTISMDAGVVEIFQPVIL